jgi:hypothetical protein
MFPINSLAIFEILFGKAYLENFDAAKLPPKLKKVLCFTTRFILAITFISIEKFGFNEVEIDKVLG